MTDTFIKDAIKTPEWVKEARKETKRLRVHLTGSQKETADYLDHIEHYETAEQYQARVKHATPNKALFSELLQPVSKVFQAKGGTRYVKAGSDSATEKLNDLLMNVEGGRSIQRWMSDIWKDRFFTDPAGVVFVESDGQFAYPTIKSIDVIRNYKRDGRQIEWILFEPQTVGEQKICRYVDRLVDQEWDVTNEEAPKLLSEIKNTFDVCPAFVNGAKESSDLTRMISDLHEVMDIADHYLRTTSVKNIHEFQHGMPVYWEIRSPCNVCHGTGFVNGSTCTSCGGDGYKKRKDVSEKILIKPPRAEDPKIAPDVAGFVEPSHKTWEQYRTEQKELIKQLHDTYLGTHRREHTSNETATGRFIDQQPVHDKLSQLADIFESTDKWIVDRVGFYHYRATYKGSSIKYGRRFMIETPSAIWDDYQKARKDGAPEAVKDYKLMQYWASELRDDLMQLEVMTKLIQVEPFVHMTPQEVMDLEVPRIDKLAKVYFSDWADQLLPDQVLDQTQEQLRKSLDMYISNKDS